MLLHSINYPNFRTNLELPRFDFKITIMTTSPLESVIRITSGYPYKMEGNTKEIFWFCAGFNVFFTCLQICNCTQFFLFECQYFVPTGMFWNILNLVFCSLQQEFVVGILFIVVKAWSFWLIKDFNYSKQVHFWK